MTSTAPVPLLSDLCPMEAVRRVRPFSDAAWAFELRPAGAQRVLVEFGGEGGVCVHSAHHVDLTVWFPEVAEVLPRHSGRVVLDGQLCVFDAAGGNDPRRLLQRCLVRGRRPGMDEVSLVVHDVLVHDDRDVRAWGWRRRRRLLDTLALTHHRLRQFNNVQAQGEWLCRQAQALGRVDILAVPRDSPYQCGRSKLCLLIPGAAS